MLTAGTDSYVTVEYADEYIAEHYLPESIEQKRWSDLGTEEKEIRLRLACEELEQLPWQGATITKDQPLAFPRAPYQTFSATEAPPKVKNAQVELALWRSDDQAQTDVAQREQLKLEGVQSVSLGSLSMSFSGDGANVVASALTCPKVRTLVLPYIRGGYDTA